MGEEKERDCNKESTDKEQMDKSDDNEDHVETTSLCEVNNTPNDERHEISPRSRDVNKNKREMEHNNVNSKKGKTTEERLRQALYNEDWFMDTPHVEKNIRE